MIARLRRAGELVTFSHTIFALPFAAAAVVLALREPGANLSPLRVLAMLGCMVAARSSAMAFNRWVDRDIDAKNPRTRARPVPAGRIAAGEAVIFAAASGIGFLLLAGSLGFWPMVLAPPVLAVLLGYSVTKRFTWASHAWLGVALALAPGGGWIATGAAPNAGILLLMAGVFSWLIGFDVLYAIQDERFDREHGLFSIPARFGTARALAIAAVAHVATVGFFAATGAALRLGPAYFGGVAVVAAVLAYEHRLVRADMQNIQRAFFDCNAYVSVAFFVATAIDRW
jgi:4-hydroxybenzoate polyprenyltransferase